ncbi:ATP-grasp domain-containing protein [Ktedonobacter racemifer]|uniref:ATP-grasp domain-containing protein n=1 Tax=Ktedonobacter racemifer DSM 44963 TaxID=485913 RepID=D6TGY4_KTERA|nr:ATP-grasp domain-containing protein [Ktedonobacter racemifer]EFH88913.1 conserved hypothetical protein [Ktedonobacter racemifer DSM 44963]
MSIKRKAGFILFGGFTASIYPAILTTLKECQFTVLVIDDPDPMYYHFLRIRAFDAKHPFWQMDEIVFISPVSQNTILKQVLAWESKYDIRGLCCIEEEFVEIAGIVANCLSVPHPGLHAARVCSDKFLQRTYLREWSPNFTVLTPRDRQEICSHFHTFPILLKPTKRHSSSGVQLINDQQTLLSRLSDYEPEENLLLEEYILGREFSVEALVQKGVVIFSNITQKRTREVNNRFFIPISHTVPAVDLTNDETANLLRTNQLALQRLEFQDGIAHAEYRIASDGRVYLIEIAARCPGGSIMTLYHLATGKPLESVIINLALGIHTDYPQPQRFARQVYLNHYPGFLYDVVITNSFYSSPIWLPLTGVVRALRPGLIDEPATLRTIIVFKSRGEWLEEVTSGEDRVATYLIDAAQPDDLDRLEQSLLAAMTVLTTI